MTSFGIFGVVFVVVVVLEVVIFLFVVVVVLVVGTDILSGPVLLSIDF